MYVKIIFAYDGSQYNGSQSQPEKNTVQDKFEEVLKVIGINNKLKLSGRTDKNVHATGQVASLQLPTFWNDLSRLKETLSKHLPNSIQIRYIKEVHEDFHARFSAKKRIYRYVISSKNISAFNTNYLHHVNNINEQNSY